MVKAIYCSLLNPYRKHANGGSEDIRRRIEASAPIFDSITVFSIDYPDELTIPSRLPNNVHLNLYERHIDPRPWRWIYPLPCIRRYNRKMIIDIESTIAHNDESFIIFIEGMQLFGLWSDIRKLLSANTKSILRVHNIESAYHLSVASESKGFLRLAHLISSYQYRPLEHRLLSDFDMIYAISSAESDVIKSQFQKLSNRVRWIPPIPEAKSLQMPAYVDNTSFRLAYFGDLTLPNNYSGLHWFCKEVLPRLCFDQVEMHIAGRGSERFTVYPKVYTYGFIDDVSQYLSNKHIIIAPISSGAGVKIKVLDAIASGKPLVTTNKGAEGLSAPIKKMMNIADTPDDWVLILERLLGSYDDANGSAIALRETMLVELGPEQFIKQVQLDLDL